MRIPHLMLLLTSVLLLFGRHEMEQRGTHLRQKNSAYCKNGLGRFVPSACFFTANGSKKREKKNNPSPPPAIVTATPTGHPTPSKLRGRVGKTSSELGVTSCRPLCARHRLGGRVSTISKKDVNLSLSCRPLERAPRASIKRHSAVTIRHRIIAVSYTHLTLPTKA